MIVAVFQRLPHADASVTAGPSGPEAIDNQVWLKTMVAALAYAAIVATVLLLIAILKFLRVSLRKQRQLDQI